MFQNIPQNIYSRPSGARRSISSFFFALFISFSVLISGCASNVDPDVYHANMVGETAITYQGTIIKVREIKIKDANKLQDNVAGAVLGAGTGIVAGSMIGSGKGSLAAATVGALLGATGGAYLEDKLSTQDGIEYIIKLNNEQLITIVQGPKNILAVGDRVIVIMSDKGRARIVRDDTGVEGKHQHVLRPAQKLKKIISASNEG